MDEITMFTALRPSAPADAEAIRERIRAKVAAAVVAAPDQSSGRVGTGWRGAAGDLGWRGSASGGWGWRASGWRGYRTAAALGAAAAVAAGTAVVVPSVLPGGSSGSFVTAAWAVERGSDGTITVTLNRTFTHQHELQTDLRADGVPAYVRSLTTCIWGPKDGEKKIFEDRKALTYHTSRAGSRFVTKIIIHPAAIPRKDVIFIAGAKNKISAGIQLFLMPNDGPPVCLRGFHLVEPYTLPTSPPSPSVSPSS